MGGKAVPLRSREGWVFEEICLISSELGLKITVAVEPDLFGYRIEARRHPAVGRSLVARRQFVTSLTEAITAAGQLIHNYLQAGLKWVGGHQFGQAGNTVAEPPPKCTRYAALVAEAS